MANNPSVTLTFAGDSKQVVRAADDGIDATDRFRQAVDKNSTQMTRDTETSTRKIRESLEDQQRMYRRTGESFEDMVNRVIRARRRADSLQKNADSLGIKEHPVFGTVFKQSSQQEGESSAESYSSGFSSGLKSTLGKFAVPAAIVGLGVLSRFIGTAGLLAGGGLVAGIGAGMAGLGLTVAAKSTVVQAHFERLAVNVEARMRQISKPFEQTLIDIASSAQQLFNIFAPELDKAFPQAARDISEFTVQLTDAFKQLAPVIEPIMDAFGKILDSLGPQLPGVFQDIANALIPLAENVAENADGFADIIVFFLQIIPLAINLINAMITFGEKWDAAWDSIISTAENAWGFITGIFGRIKDAALQVAPFVGDVFGRMKDAIVQRFTEVLHGARDFPSAMKAALGDLGRILWDAGWRLIGGLIDGIKARFGEVMGTLRNLTAQFPSWKGPSDVDSKLLVHSGQLIIEGLVVGLRQKEPDVKSYLNDLTRFIGGFGPDQPNLAANRGASESRPRRIELGSDGTAMGDALTQLVINAIRRAGGDPSVLEV